MRVYNYILSYIIFRRFSTFNQHTSCILAIVLYVVYNMIIGQRPHSHNNNNNFVVALMDFKNIVVEHETHANYIVPITWSDTRNYPVK